LNIEYVLLLHCLSSIKALIIHEKYTKSLLMKLTETPWYTEGPVMDEAGNIYFTTLHEGMMIKSF